MAAERIEEFYDRVKRFHDEENFRDVIPEVDSSGLIPKLREYQTDAVKWMLYKEYQCDIDQLPQEYDGMEIKYPKGGILADEMGLGKTVEMISLILNNPCNIPHCYGSRSDLFLDFTDSSQDSNLEKAKESGKDEDKREEQENQNVNDYETLRDECASSSKPETAENVIDESEVNIKSGKSLRKRRNVSYAGLDADFENEPLKKRRKKKPDPEEKPKSNYEYLRSMYELALSEVNHSPYKKIREHNDSLKCCCTGYVNSDEIRCHMCHSVQHKVCVGLQDFSVRKYFCPKCLVKMKPFKSRATFIVSPDAIVHQWMDEIKRHVKNDKLKVFYYAGVKGSKYIQPAELADNDIVITTYSVLCSDLNYCVEESTRSLRYTKKFHTFPPPIKAIDWWRICLDEAQMVEGANTKPGIMARELNATHRWAVTGTPIQKSINDLYGLMQFFMMEPLCDFRVWNELMLKPDVLNNILSHLLWRSRKKHVYAMLGIPEQKVLTHWLHFSPVEGHFYERTHNDCTAQFQEKLNRFEDLNVTLSSLDRGFVSRMMIPLLSLRQACTHPQAVRGKFLKYKRTMTMEELLSDMVLHARQDVDHSVRTIVSCLNGQAGLKVLLGELQESIHLYRQVLQLPSQHPKDIIKVDKLQRLHTLHNLAEIIREFGVSEPTLHDDTLAQDAEALASNYIQKYTRLIESSFETMKQRKKQVKEMSEGRPLGYSDWWEKVLTRCDDARDLVDRVRTNVLDQQTKFPIKNSYSNKIRNMNTLYGELGLWLAETDEARIALIKSLKVLFQKDAISLSQQALCCHLRTDRDKNTRKKCSICSFETNMLAYESRIFAITKEDQEGRKKNKYARSDSEDNLDNVEDEEMRKEIETLKEINIIRTKKEGNWRPSQMERIIQVIHTFAKNKKFSSGIIKDGQKHLALLEAVRKEFLSIRTLWRHISDRVAAYDELTMAKIRFRLPLEEELKAIQKKKLKEPYIIQQHEIYDQIERLSNEKIVSERDLSRNIGILMYLQNLQKNPNTERDPCPVCQEPLSNKWSVLQCGHCFCFECIPNMFPNAFKLQVDCAVCRRKTHRNGIAYVDCTAQRPQDEHFPVVGSHSTKIEAVIVRALKLLKDDSTQKFLVFSSWDKVLDVISEAFELNDISFRRLSNNKKKSNKSLADFKNSDVTAFLLPLRLGSKGLNLIEATHVFFVEPILNPGEELQAVGRVHRIGQMKETFVHRFVIHNTIEEKMLSALSTSSSEEWSTDRVTVKQLSDLFNRQNNPSTSNT